MNAQEQDKSIIVHVADPKNAKLYLIPALIHLTRAINSTAARLIYINQMNAEYTPVFGERHYRGF